ncbi:MAG: polyketide synthase dehydratase domain-containing protein [Ignavibacteria bacterium]|nr:polyketide synthase dehydratase domain-containing protein [Ignavibacteria bacterium]
MLQSLGILYVNGVNPDWNEFDKDFSHKIISLPNYPFQKQRYWIEDLIKAKSILTDFSAGDNSDLNPLPGKKVISASKNEFIFNTSISGSNPDYLKDHIVFDKLVLPGAVYVEIALSASDELLNQTPACVSDMIFHQALVLETDESKNVQSIFTKEENNKFSFRIFSLDKTDENSDNLKWTLHASGFLSNEKNEKRTRC